MKMTGSLTRLLLGACLMTAMVTEPAYALIVPSPIATDARIKTIMYSPNEVFKFTGF